MNQAGENLILQVALRSILTAYSANSFKGLAAAINVARIELARIEAERKPNPRLAIVGRAG